LDRSGGNRSRSLSTRSATASYALIKVVYDQIGHDYIDNFVPFAMEAMRQAGEVALSVGDIQGRVQASFHLSIPQGALRTILGRAVSRGLCKVDHRTYTADLRAIGGLNFPTLFEKALSDERALVRELSEFSQQHLLTAWTPEQAETALLRYIQDRGPSLLAFALRANPLADSAPVDDESYVLNSFVQRLATSDSGSLASFAEVVEGSLLASGLYFPEIGQLGQRFQSLCVYLDTRLLLDALGYAGPELAAPVRELLDLLYELGAQLRCFDHTIVELRGVLTHALDAVKYRANYQTHSGEVIEYLIKAGYRPSDVEVLITTLDKSLNDLRVTVTPHPRHTEQLTVDEPKLEGRLRDRINYRSDAVLRHDLDSVTAIYRLRRGETRDRLETAGSIFVTTNYPLADVTARFFSDEYRRSEIPLVLPDYQIATLAWLKKPTAAPDLPMKYVIAGSYAAFVPTEDLWHRYLDELARLEASGQISEQDYVLLRHNMAAKSLLVRETHGRPDAFTTDTVPVILRKTKEAIAAELRPAVEAALRPTIAEAVRSETERSYHLRLSNAEADAQSARHEADEQRLRAMARLDRQRLHLQGIADRAARGLLSFPVAILGITLLATSYQGLGWLLPALPIPDLSLPSWLDIPVKVVGIGAGIGLLVVLVLNVWSNHSVSSLTRQAETAVSSKLQSVLLRLVVPDE
jgi:hypothetical protein